MYAIRSYYDLQDVLLELGELVEEEDAVVRQGDLAGAGQGAAADEPGVGDGVVGRAEGAHGDQVSQLGPAGPGQEFGGRVTRREIR